MGVVAESMTALVLASEALRKFGGDSLAEVVRNRDGFLDCARHDAVGSAVGQPGMTTRILLVGMMGAGKTTTGQLLAQRLGWGYRDSDADVEAATGLTVPELFSRDGEAAFRDGGGRGARRCLRRCRTVGRLGGGRRGPEPREPPPHHGERHRRLAPGEARDPRAPASATAPDARSSATTRRRRWSASTRCAPRSTPRSPTS